MSAVDDDDLPPVPREKLSRAPSWMMVGFVLGGISACVAQREWEEPAPTASVDRSAPVITTAPTPEPSATPARPIRMNQEEIDAVFRENAGNAMWENDLTQIAMWNPQTKKFSDLVEVMRSGDFYYYRPLTRLTRPLITAEAESGALVLFTETETSREARLKSIPPIFRPPPPRLDLTP